MLEENPITIPGKLSNENLEESKDSIKISSLTVTQQQWQWAPQVEGAAVVRSISGFLYAIQKQFCDNKPLFRVIEPQPPPFPGRQSNTNSQRQFILKAYDASKTEKFEEYQREIATLAKFPQGYKSAVKMIDHGLPYSGMPELKYTECGKQKLLSLYCFIILPEMENGSLLDLLINAKHYNGLSEDSQQFLIANIVRAVQSLHRDIKAAHLDIKPDNVMLGEDFVPTLIDFGLSDELSAKLQRWSTTINYVPYEVYPYYSGKPKDPGQYYLAEPVDVFCLGVTMFIILFLAPPFMLSPSHTSPEKDPFYSLLLHTDKNAGQSVFFKFHGEQQKTKVAEHLKELIWRCLQPNIQTRMTMDQLYNHKYIQSAPVLPSQRIVEELKRCCVTISKK